LLFFSWYLVHRMAVLTDTNEYALGSDAAEHARLIRQAAWLSEHTERFFSHGGSLAPGSVFWTWESGVGGRFFDRRSVLSAPRAKSVGAETRPASRCGARDGSRHGT